MRHSNDQLWDRLRIDDAAPPYVYRVTAEKIVRYCRAARYENLVYNNQPAAREMGLPGIIAPPAMVFVYAPVRVSALLESASSDAMPPPLSPERIQLSFQGTLVQPEETVTSVTTVAEKLERDGERRLVLRVVAHNQGDELVAEYLSTYRWGEAAG